MHFPRNECQFEFGGHFGSDINVYKIETFLMLDITFAENFIDLLQEMLYVDIKNDFSQTNPSWN